MVGTNSNPERRRIARPFSDRSVLGVRRSQRRRQAGAPVDSICESMYLPVEDRVQIFVFHFEGSVMRRQLFIREERRQTVVRFGKAGLHIEFSLILEDGFSKGGDVVRGQVQAVETR